MVVEWYDAEFKNLNQGIKNVLELKEIMSKIDKFLQIWNIFDAVVKLYSTQHHTYHCCHTDSPSFFNFFFQVDLVHKTSSTKEMKTVEKTDESRKVLDQRD